MLELVNTMAISYIIISVLDYLFIKNFNSRYFLIHVLVNAYIIFICLFDTFNVLFNTIETLKLRTTDNTALYLMLTLHLYHITPNIGFKLNFIDYLHHFSSAFLGGRIDYSSTTIINETVTTEKVKKAIGAKVKAINGGNKIGDENIDILDNSVKNVRQNIVGGDSEMANDIRDYEQYKK